MKFQQLFFLFGQGGSTHQQVQHVDLVDQVVKLFDVEIRVILNKKLHRLTGTSWASDSLMFCSHSWDKAAVILSM
jgi:hypothetical protein